MTSFVRIALAGAGTYAKIEIRSGDDISDLAKRACTEFPSWRMDPSQLSLYLVAAGGDDMPLPSAVDSARHLDQIGWSLTRAGISSGAWLVARKIVDGGASLSGGGGGVGGAAGGARIASDVRAAFVALLLQARITPKEAVLTRLQQNKDSVFFSASTAEEAKHWYDWAKDLPLSPTRGRFKSRTGYTLNGPWSSYSSTLLTAFDDQGAAALLKVVPSRADPEVVAALALSGGPFVVSASFCSAARDDGSEFCGLLMPKYERSLDAAPEVLLPQVVLFSRAKALLDALRHVHAAGFVHMDVKEANVFVDAAGCWALGDFGSAVREGEPIMSTTRGLHPGLAGWWAAAHPPLLARREYDLYMAAGLLVRQLDVPAVRLACGDEGPRVEELRARAARVEHDDLRALLIGLVDEAIKG